MNDKLIIRGASENNLKNINLELEKNKLIVISGLSGSGKSSLAFDTIFAEGQRRYVESLSAYARQFLGRLDKPAVDSIEGLSPAIAIEQKTTNKNPRSTVGTITEIYDYYRLLWARVGEVHCPNCNRVIDKMSTDQIADAIMSEGGINNKVMIMAPVVMGRKGEYKKIISDAKNLGYERLIIDGDMFTVDDKVVLDKQKKHNISVVVDRIILRIEDHLRLAEAIEKSADMTDGLIEVKFIGDTEHTKIYSEKNSCAYCGISIGEIESRTFSFNNPFGACSECNGLGYVTRYDISKIIPDSSLSFNQGAIASMSTSSSWSRSSFEGFAKSVGFTSDTPINQLSPDQYNKLLYGSDEKFTMDYSDKSSSLSMNRHWYGLINDLKRRFEQTDSISVKTWISSFQSELICPLCKGERLKKEALSVYISGKNINQVSALNVKNSLDFFNNIELSKTKKIISEPILKEIRARLNFLNNVGLDYLNINRSSGTLSGGESQRIRLATQIGSALSGVLYVLDEPSIGLHQRDNRKLIQTLKELRDLGNTVIVVEHDSETILSADYVVDIGPGAGENGGYIVAQGTPRQIINNEKSLTGLYLSGKLQIKFPDKRRKGNGKYIKLIGVDKNNVNNVDFSFPLGKLIALTGVSGSGKSTVLNQVLTPAIKQKLYNTNGPIYCKEVLGLKYIDKIIQIDQSPIGRTPRSNPATYVGLYTQIRDIFASLPESRARGYTSGRFSFNVPGGRCENCQGDGKIKIEMNFLPDVYVLCDVCHGKRYNKETLAVKYKGKSISDVLDMTVEEALVFFESYPPLKRKLQTLADVGLGYIKLGQSALTLSGGEAQRIKLSLELSKIGTGNTLYILDEPTTGLHFDDIKHLMDVLNKLVDKGNTVILIEHNLDVIKMADYVIDLGPEGGDGGGHIVAEGTPEDVALSKDSYTGYYLRQVLS